MEYRELKGDIGLFAFRIMSGFFITKKPTYDEFYPCCVVYARTITKQELFMNEKILIIDDEADILESLEEILSQEGFRVRGASGGIEAIEIFRSQPFDLVITDLRMPHMDGMEVLNQVKQLDEFIEVIVLTGFANIENAITALKDNGAYDYLTKPLEDIDRLLISVNHALERRRLRIENRSSIKRIEEANAQLERRVEERTAELAKVNDQLRHEIEERRHWEEVFRKSQEEYKVLYNESKMAEEVYRSLLNTSADAIIIYDMEGKTKYANPAFTQIFGWTIDEVKGKPIDFVPESEKETVIAHVRDIVEYGKICSDFETKRFTKDGRLLDVSVSGSRYNDHAGKATGILSILRDISKRKKAQAQLQEAQKIEAITTLAGGIAHQFNNALTSITGHTGLLEMKYPEDERIMEYARAMKQSAHRMTYLTNQLLAYARGGKYNPRPMSLSVFVADALPVIKHTLDPAIRVETDLPLDVMNVEVDRTQMQAVLPVIVANSNEAIEGPGRIRISVRNVELDMEFIKDHPGLTPGPYVCLSVEDDGKGMDEETKNRIFDPFFTTHFIGRGLGMAAVYGIVTNHDGTIRVDSEPGKGTVVNIYLPAVEAREEAEEEVVLRLEAELARGEGTILVIEDEEQVVMLIRKTLETAGYRVLEARTGKEAVGIARTFDGDIDLALLDIKLPDTSGENVYPLIMEARPDLKVIVCTGYSIEGPAQEILDAGAQGFIQKPFSISTLAEKLKEVLQDNNVRTHAYINKVEEADNE